LKSKLEKGEVKFEDHSIDIPVKGTNSSVFIDGSTEKGHFSDYQFLKRTQSEIVKPVKEETSGLSGLKKNLKKKIDAANL